MSGRLGRIQSAERAVPTHRGIIEGGEPSFSLTVRTPGMR